MKKSYFIAVGIAVFAILWVVSGMLTAAPPAETQNNEAAVSKEDKLVEVRIREIEAEPVTDDVVVTGRTQAARQVLLKAEVEGQVVAIAADKGEAVSEGQVIAELEKRDRPARLAEAKERLAQRTIEYNAAESLENKGFNSRVRLAQAKADLEEARAELKRAETDLDKLQVKAPFDGVIYEQFIEVGDFAGVGSDIFSIVDLDPLEARGYLTEQQVQKIEKNKPAKASFINGTTVDGVVSYIAPAADAQTRTFAVDLSLPNPEGRLVDGMTVQIRIPAQQTQAHKISPSVLSLNDAGQVGVKAVNDQGKVEFLPVRILSDHPDYMYVGGLPETVRIITVGQDFVVPGQDVKAVPAEGDGLL